jgi:hypothetical protein
MLKLALAPTPSWGDYPMMRTFARQKGSVSWPSHIHD